MPVGLCVSDRFDSGEFIVHAYIPACSASLVRSGAAEVGEQHTWLLKSVDGGPHQLINHDFPKSFGQTTMMMAVMMMMILFLTSCCICGAQRGQRSRPGWAHDT